MKSAIFFILFASTLLCCGQNSEGSNTAPEGERTYQVQHSEQEWREMLSPEQFRVLREQGTERAFTGAYHDQKEKGMYHCAACDAVLFNSDTKFDSGTGWPSFYDVEEEENVEEIEDRSYGMIRTEVVCGRCGGHLGHVFPDGPEPTGLRYCINSISLQFVPR